MGKSLGPGKDPDLDIVRSADASRSDLQRIAGTRPDLLPDIAAHPNAYPDLLAWLATHQDPAIQDALARCSSAVGITLSSRSSAPTTACPVCRPELQSEGMDYAGGSGTA